MTTRDAIKTPSCKTGAKLDGANHLPSALRGRRRRHKSQEFHHTEKARPQQDRPDRTAVGLTGNGDSFFPVVSKAA